MENLWKSADPNDKMFTEYDGVFAHGGRALFLGGRPDQFTALVELDVGTAQWRPLRQVAVLSVDAAHLSIPESVCYPGDDADDVHAFYYAPTHPDITGPGGASPPLLVISHGGPTGATSTALNLSIQFWTSHGFAVLDVNYRGSTGYGRAYRDRLAGKWGILDVSDCVRGAQWACETGLAGSDQLIIRGGSAGGFTTLCALAFFDMFRAGASYYGVSDLAGLARMTHKFESRYLEKLMGREGDLETIYQTRSPLHYADQIHAAMIFFQGSEDAVVPPEQTELMVDALKLNGVPVAYLCFEGERHGFRRSENIARALDAEYGFYLTILGITPPHAVEPICIHNL